MRISDWSSDVCSSDLPELHHLYAGQGSVDSGGIDYYRCATEQPDVPFEDCDFSNEGFQLDRSGDMTLEPETSTSWTAGVVWSPMPELDFTLEWYDIEMRNQTQSLSVNKILQEEYEIGRAHVCTTVTNAQ